MKSFLFLSIFLIVIYFCDITNGEEVEQFSCEPKANFKINCNHCRCGLSGKWAECNTEYCDPIDNSKYMEAPKDCDDRYGWYDGCNSVRCDAVTNGEEQKEVFSCEPNEHFSINCNFCTCSKTGTWAECEAEYCNPNDPTKLMDPPADCARDWFDGCNYRDCDGN
ncbi:unnamed protein product [Diamesa tonsa]